jgi:hypothetical protein
MATASPDHTDHDDTRKVTQLRLPSPSSIRGLIRAALICVTAFGFQLTAEQVAAVQLVAEAALGVFYRPER